MKVSIITATWQSAHTLEECIRSVLGQSYPAIEYLVVDGGSDDGSRELIAKYENEISCWVSEPDEGMYDAMNKGIAMASGDVIGFLHADDIYTRTDAISLMVDKMEKEGSDAAYADLEYVDANKPDKVLRKWRSGAYRHGLFLNGWMPPHPTVFLRKSVYERYGGFNTDLGTAADYELILRFLHKERISVSYLPETIIRMRAGGQSNASLANRWRANRNDRKAWRVNGLRPRPWTLLLKPLRKVGQFRLW